MSSSTQAAGLDPDLARMGDITTPPELGDTLTVPSAYVDKSPISVEWSQSLKTKRDTYYQLAYTNTSKNNAKYFLFVSSGKFEDFKKLNKGSGAGGNITFKVTADFQYGQKDSKGKNRFLVFHESDRNIYQSRFIKASWLKYGTMASGFVDNFKGGSDASQVLEMMNKFVGDALKRFN